MLNTMHRLFDMLNWMTTTSADGKSICCHMLVLILEFTSITALGLSPWVYLWVGYTTLQCMLALVLLTEFRAGSCMERMSQSFKMGLLRSDSWVVWDVLIFCCQMQRWGIVGISRIGGMVRETWILAAWVGYIQVG